MDGFNNAAILGQVKEVQVVSDIKKVAQMLSSGKWIAFYATATEPWNIVLGRVLD